MHTDILESSTHRRGTLRPPVPLPSPLTPSVSFKKLLASQNAIMRRLVEIGECQVGRLQHHHQPQDSVYLDFLATHPPVFTKTTDLLEANDWIFVTESKFGLLHCSELQKTFFAEQQLRGSARTDISMNFIMNLPSTTHKVDSI
jgi:hypothetical protein